MVFAHPLFLDEVYVYPDKGEHPVHFLCKVLQVSLSGYYDRTNISIDNSLLRPHLPGASESLLARPERGSYVF